MKFFAIEYVDRDGDLIIEHVVSKEADMKDFVDRCATLGKTVSVWVLSEMQSKDIRANVFSHDGIRAQLVERIGGSER